MIILQLSPKHVEYLCDTQSPPKAHANAMNSLKCFYVHGDDVQTRRVCRGNQKFLVFLHNRICYDYFLICDKKVINEFRSEFSELIHVREDEATYGKVVHFQSRSFLWHQS